MSISEKTLGEILYAVTTKDINELSVIPESVRRIGMTGPLNYGLSKCRPESAIKKAKLSTVILVVDRILSERANALEQIDRPYVYAEFKTLEEISKGSREIQGMTFDGAAITYNNTGKRKTNGDYCTALFMYALHSQTGYDETKEIFAQVLEYYYDKKEPLLCDHIYKLCDAFYYESLTGLSTQKFTIYDTLNIDLIKQSVRTGQFQRIAPLDDVAIEDRMEMGVKFADEDSKADNVVTNDDLFMDCRAGVFILDHMWDYERQKYIPDLNALDDFVPNECYYTMVQLIKHELNTVMERMSNAKTGNAAIQDNYINCQFIGRPGTGKSTIANALGATFGVPVRVIVNSKNTEEDTFQGMTKVQEGGFKFVSTPFLDAYKNGGIIILEEYNLTDPGVAMGALGQSIEKPFILLEDGYKEVRRHELCVIIATANTGTQGSREPSEALTSRLPHVFLLDDPKEKEFIEILQKRSKADYKTCKKVYSAYTKILTFLTKPEINAEDVALSITLRHCLAALKQMEIGKNLKQAITNTIAGTIAIKDIDLAKKVIESVIEPMKK